jgi:hypothetical protein
MRKLLFETLERRDLLSNVEADLFIDGGANLSRSVQAYAADEYGISHNDLRTSSASKTRAVINGNENDINGALLDINNEPSYLAVYVNGGSATKHGKVLGEIGRSRFNEFFNDGGSYVGSCAGAWFAKYGKNYANLWDGVVKNSGRSGYQTVSFADCDGPFCEYLTLFNVPEVVKSIRHIGGPKFSTNYDYPIGTKFYGTVTSGVAKGSPYIITYQTETSGMLVIVPGHPEYSKSGDRMNLMAAMLSFAIDNSRVTTTSIDSIQLGEGESLFINYQIDNITTNINDTQYTTKQLNYNEVDKAFYSEAINMISADVGMAQNQKSNPYILQEKIENELEWEGRFDSMFRRAVYLSLFDKQKEDSKGENGDHKK